MKTTLDNKQVPSRIWYYLLDWNEADEWETIKCLYNKDKLKDLTKREIYNLLFVASQSDIQNSNK